MQIITNYKSHKIVALDGSLKKRLQIVGPKINHIIHGGGLKVAILWIDSK